MRIDLNKAQAARCGLLAALALSACTGAGGKNGKNGDSGRNGDAGTEGHPSLIHVADEPSGAHCPSGGKRIDTGLDTNASGVLDANEVTASTYVCAGAPGANGVDGSAGPSGSDGATGSAGRSSLVRTSPELAGANCAYGGVRIETGIDANDDGVLQDSEVSAGQTQFLCEPPGVGACAPGGALPIGGDYKAPEGTEHWLRRTATAATYSVVPAGPPVLSNPARLFRIEHVCGQALLLLAPDGTASRLDWSTAAGSFRICVRPASSIVAAAGMVIPDPDVAAGCASGPWTTLAKETP